VLDASLRGNAVLMHMVAAAPGAPLFALSSDADEAPIVQLSVTSAEPKTGQESSSDESDSGLVTSISNLGLAAQLAMLGGVLAIAGIVAVAVFVGRRRAAAARITGSSGSNPSDSPPRDRRDSSVGETMLNPISLPQNCGKHGMGGDAARRARIQQLRREQQPSNKS
jgi:hypothetical protein